MASGLRLVALALAAALCAEAASAPELAVSALPTRVYAEPVDAIAERWSLRLVVKTDAEVTLDELAVDVFSGATRLRTEHYPGPVLDALRGDPLPSFAGVDETLNLTLGATERRDVRVDRLRLTLTGRTGERAVAASVEVPVERYAPHADLRFPLDGPVVVVAGHDPGEPHETERSQRFACDLVGVGADGRPTRSAHPTRTRDWVGFGRPVYAPAAGTVVRARGDLPDNRPGEVPTEAFYRSIRDVEDRLAAVAGNAVLIDHGGGEYSLLGHLARGSVRVKAGDRVARGQLLGRVGNSGNSTSPHLHYHLMNGPLLFRSDGLPARFADLSPAPDGRLQRGVVYRRVERPAPLKAAGT